MAQAIRSSGRVLLPDVFLVDDWGVSRLSEPQPLVKLLERALKLDPAGRPPDGRAFQEGLSRVLSIQ